MKYTDMQEFEREMIVELTQEGKAIAKKRDDFLEGRQHKYSKKTSGTCSGVVKDAFL